MDFERDPELLAAVKELPKRLREVGMTSPADMLVKLLEKKVRIPSLAPAHTRSPATAVAAHYGSDLGRWQRADVCRDRSAAQAAPVVQLVARSGSRRVSTTPARGARTATDANWCVHRPSRRVLATVVYHVFVLVTNAHAEHDLFRVIPPWELLGMGWMKPDKNVRYDRRTNTHIDQHNTTPTGTDTRPSR